jgi:hypothetical protein
VKSLRLHVIARLFTAVWLMVSWLVATNHCAFGLMKPTPVAGAVHAQCHGCPAPGKQAPADGTRECCRAIQGAPVPEKVGGKFESPQVALEWFAFPPVLSFSPVSQEGASLLFEEGPPRAVSFAESVLQRSLLSHAPPYAA